MYSIAAAAGGTGLAPTRFGSGSPHSVLDSGRRHEGARVVWRVQCGDLISRDRCVAVYVDDGEVVLVGPPGEAARLSADQLWQLRAALNEAAELAER